MNSTNVTQLVGATLLTARDFTIDNQGVSFEARRRNPAQDDRKIPAGTQIVGVAVVKGRLVAKVEGFGTVAFHANHIPESGTVYKMAKSAIDPTASWAEKPQQLIITQQDPDVLAAAERLAAVKARIAKKQADEAKAAALKAIEDEIAALEAGL